MTEIAIPTMTPVVSSNVESIGFGDDTLFVRFKNGGTYRYATADKTVHDAMLKAESPGKFFRSEIAGKHKGEKL